MQLSTLTSTIRWHYQHLYSWHLHTSQLEGWDHFGFVIIICSPWAIIFYWPNASAVCIFLAIHLSMAILWVNSHYYSDFDTLFKYAATDIDIPKRFDHDKDTTSRTSWDLLEPYSHDSLRPEAFIRLLILQPSIVESAALRGQLIECPLSVYANYSALSYTWGEGKVDTIIIDNRRLSITRSCSSALRNLRSRFWSRLIWVDAICIDQDNVRERESQIQRMHLIYSRCSRSIIWLGDGGNGDEFAFRYFRLYSRGFANHLYQRYALRSIFRVSGKRGYRQPLQELYQHGWFQRIWTIQEAALAPGHRAIFRCGLLEADYSAMIDGFLRFQNSYYSDIAYPLNHCLTTSVLQLRIATRSFNGSRASSLTDILMRKIFRNLRHQNASDAIRKFNQLPLSKLFLHLNGQRATDPKDKVYGVLAILHMSGISTFPQPNYSKSLPHVYWDLMRTICVQEHSLLLLTLRIEPREADMLDAPTWVPDLRVSASPRQVLSESFHATSLSRSEFSLSSDQLMIHTLAIHVETVSRVSSYALWKPSSTDSHQYMNDRLTMNLEEGALQTIEALRNWFWISLGSHGQAYDPERIHAFKQAILWDTSEYSTHIRDENFQEWLYLVMSDDQSWTEMFQRTGISLSDTFSDPIVREQILETHAYIRPVLRSKFFDPSSPLHQLTRDPYWRILCALKCHENTAQIQHYVWTLMKDSRFFVTGNGCMGTGPVSMEPGDHIFLIPGVNMPMVLRSKGPADHYEVVGPAHIHELLDGTVWDRMREDSPNAIHSIVLV